MAAVVSKGYWLSSPCNKIRASFDTPFSTAAVGDFFLRRLVRCTANTCLLTNYFRAKHHRLDGG